MLNLLMDLQDEIGVAYVFISHNLSVVEHDRRRGDGDVPRPAPSSRAPKAAIFATPRHPYTRALLASTPRIGAARGEAALATAARAALSGELPSPLAPPSGCVFRTRCPHAMPRCAETVPPLEAVGERARGRLHPPRRDRLSSRAGDRDATVMRPRRPWSGGGAASPGRRRPRASWPRSRAREPARRSSAPRWSAVRGSAPA